MNHCVLYVLGNDNTNANDNIIFTKAQNYMFLKSLYQQKTIKNNQNFLAKYLKDQCIGMDIKKK